MGVFGNIHDTISRAMDRAGSDEMWSDRDEPDDRPTGLRESGDLSQEQKDLMSTITDMLGRQEERDLQMYPIFLQQAGYKEDGDGNIVPLTDNERAALRTSEQEEEFQVNQILTKNYMRSMGYKRSEDGQYVEMSVQEQYDVMSPAEKSDYDLMTGYQEYQKEQLAYLNSPENKEREGRYQDIQDTEMGLMEGFQTLKQGELDYANSSEGLGRKDAFRKLEDRMVSLQNAYITRQELALNGEVPITPAMERSIAKRKTVMEEDLSRRLGPNWQSTTAGIQAMSAFEWGNEETKENMRINIISQGEGLMSSRGNSINASKENFNGSANLGLMTDKPAVTPSSFGQDYSQSNTAFNAGQFNSGKGLFSSMNQGRINNLMIPGANTTTSANSYMGLFNPYMAQDSNITSMWNTNRQEETKERIAIGQNMSFG